ncbi:OmpP1/FadL family transporter [Magnetospirillum molischianum]|uniref:Membrane protein involved in aromatic hydrocarbon degradation n=1 Tax=Magnetospirillum molischianum DSM 120 TaxID=1150626 RepID=H8FSX0_MAGML|nr:outer membrane protein transport protein [Magnetospirillum molischianum]CCG41458.1 Membrane protein involved in aromatic hydrocarbon degradation [Magnetospirillum molischianum DSM 120]
MSQMIRRQACMGMLGLISALAASADAQAAGFALREQSAEGLGNAFAGSTAKAYDLSTIYYNPAGMTRLEGSQVAGSTTYIMPTAEFNGQASLRNRSVRGTTGEDAIMDAAVGSVYAMWDADPDLKVGLAVTAPYGLRSHYKPDWVGRYHALQSNITNINANPSIAYRINQNLSIGAGVQFDYTKVTLSQALNFGLTDGKSTVQGDAIGYGGNFGALWEFSPTSRIGLNYRSQIQHTISGKAKFEGIPTPYLASPRFANDSASANLTTPDTVALGLYHELSPRWAVMSDVQWTRWSSFKELRVKFGNGRNDSVVDESWHDTWFLSAGATYTTESSGKVHFGLAYDQSATDDTHRTARVPDSNRYWVSAGYTYDLTNNNQFNIGYAHLFADKAPLNELGTAETGTLTGEYVSSVDIVSTSLSMKF